jgi:hypothetical protein
VRRKISACAPYQIPENANLWVVGTFQINENDVQFSDTVGGAKDEEGEVCVRSCVLFGCVVYFFLFFSRLGFNFDAFAKRSQQ